MLKCPCGVLSECPLRGNWKQGSWLTQFNFGSVRNAMLMATVAGLVCVTTNGVEGLAPFFPTSSQAFAVIFLMMELSLE